MRANKWCKDPMAFLAVCILTGMYSSSAAAGDYKLGYSADISENDYAFTTKSPKGTIGKSTPIPFRTRVADGDAENLHTSLLQTNESQQVGERGDGDYSVDCYPSEIMKIVLVAKSVGTIKKGNTKNVPLSARVRRNALQGYYNIPVLLEWDGGSDTDYINVWISTLSASGVDEEEGRKEGNYFAMGKSQPTPRGIYPSVMDYTINLHNKRETTVQGVTVSMQLLEDDAKFPFEINDSNYDRTFKRVQSGETVSAPYSVVIHKDSYMGYYPVKYIIILCLNSEEDLHTKGGTFYVHIVPKDKGGDLGDSNANNRTRARLIVESYHTAPGEIYAGGEFELTLNMKNASTSAPTSSILSNPELEKASDSAVFITESDTSSLVVNSMTPGQTTKVRTRSTARAGVDQRSYATTVKEKYDSPKFKSTEESIVVDTPVKQYTRLSTSIIGVMPDSLIVGSESNAMLGINNTGGVILYNVTVISEADLVKTTGTYMRDIKSGGTGSVDTMLTGVAPILDEGMMRIRIDYEDENGVPVELVGKELTLMVMEEMEQNWDDAGVATDASSMDAEAVPFFWSKHKFLVIAGVVAVAGTAAAVVIRIRRKHKTAREGDMGDEIS